MNYEQFRKAISATGDKFHVEWTTGGDRGHDCYGKEYGQFESEQEPEFDELDAALTVVAPSIAYLQYKALTKAVVRRDSQQRDDYYGVHEDIAFKEVFLRELHAWLQEKGLLTVAPTR